MRQKKINNLVNEYVIYGAGEAGKQIYSSLEVINRKVFCCLLQHVLNIFPFKF